LKASKGVFTICALSLFLAVSSTGAPSGHPDFPAGFIISPLVMRANVSETITLTINITNVQNLYLWCIDLKYNGTMLNLTDIWIPEENVFKGYKIGTETGEANQLDPLNFTDFGGSVVLENRIASVTNAVCCKVNFTVLGVGQSEVTVALASDPVHIPGGFQWSSHYGTYQDSGFEMHFDCTGNICTVNGAGPRTLREDIDCDGTVDILDAITLAAAFGSKPGDTAWNNSADVKPDGVIDILDVITVALHFGQTSP
jgi:hypothetical protein